MATIIGRNEVYVECDHIGCHKRSGGARTSIEADKLARLAGWYVAFHNDDAKCPDHSPWKTDEHKFMAGEPE